MFAVYATRPDPADPLAALRTGERPEPEVPPGWAEVTLRAASLNMHDLNTLRGVRMSPERYPMILGCDGAGVLADGAEVVLHSLIGAPDWHGPEQLDPQRTVLSELHQGTFAERVAVPEANLVRKPAALSFAEATCLPTAWLTAYRMLFTTAAARPGQTVLVHGRRRLGSIAGAVLQLAAAAGCTVWAALPQAQHELAVSLGAHRVFALADRLPGQVDAVLDAGVEETGWTHALRWLRPGGTLVCAGWRTGAPDGEPPAHLLNELIFRELRLAGSTMGTAAELAELLAFLEMTGVRPPIAAELPLTRAAEGFELMLTGRVSGKIVFTAAARP
ncbi:zinc-binding dehydrogenase [Crossiella sp. SN42]|uniref:quinone oxidoreductase family protein n=1 Tax=Crossiella sp. SN42 TaxID=2944808 RepID=UPI00207D09ED|nr:zinc-binding dehydrogenase [Crossiella sp. SN42]MCO1580352.1 zinc-binding dehydrogenase [Crossiella sp. SN42]